VAEDVYPDSTIDNTIETEKGKGQNTMAGSNVENKEKKE